MFSSTWNEYEFFPWNENFIKFRTEYSPFEAGEKTFFSLKESVSFDLEVAPFDFVDVQLYFESLLFGLKKVFPCGKGR